MNHWYRCPEAAGITARIARYVAMTSVGMYVPIESSARPSVGATPPSTGGDGGACGAGVGVVPRVSGAPAPALRAASVVAIEIDAHVTPPLSNSRNRNRGNPVRAPSSGGLRGEWRLSSNGLTPQPRLFMIASQHAFRLETGVGEE